MMTNAIRSMMDMWLGERKDNSSSSGKSNDSPRKSDSKTGAQLYHQFSLANIREATKDFSKSLLVRNSDKVYKGSVNIDGKALVVAIIRFKKLEGVGDEIHPKRLLLHPNILSPIGFCTEGDELILVYDYMANGSLQDYLHHNDTPLSWEMRLQICIGAAQGLEYLNVNGELELIHRCIEPSSILLDENWVAKVMLSNIRTMTNTSTCLLRSTTMHYNSRYQGDVLYSFGVMLLEVLICNKRLGRFFDERKQLGDYRNPKYPDMPLKHVLDDIILSDNVYQVMDPHLVGKIGSECLGEFVKITWRCLFQQGFGIRTSINYVVRSLQFAVHLQENWQSLNASSAAWTQSNSNEDISVNIYQEALNLSPADDWTEDSVLRAYWDLYAMMKIGGRLLFPSQPMWERRQPVFLRISPEYVIFRQTGQISQSVSLAANAAGGTDSSHGNNLSRNGTNVADVIPSLDVVPAGPSSKQYLSFSNNQNPIDGGVVQSDDTCRCFSLDEILIATDNFDDALVIGIGGFGKVYKGFIDDGATMVAIKRLNAESEQGAGEFWTKIKMLSKLQHTHLVALIGYCNECQEMTLIYEYMALGTLADHLYNASIPPPTWEQRLNMCIGATRGLDHLHCGTTQSFIHRDLKTTNILIDENWVAKISDFRLMSKDIASHSITHISTDVKGTFGYLDPDYLFTQRLTIKSDVYAFSVVNPGNAPLVVGQLLDDKCPEDFIKSLILSSCSLLTIEPLMTEFEKRSALILYLRFSSLAASDPHT
ncbi:hypothetical protein RHSIM_Rhsim02G0065000 [Rhododendron simsii]|uniref:Protein kinase domain-containing protein n=1 Tax=Rhododendron simsii TaxID=118357 RepID=A0A834HP01_RHOSS|nr:hypothetical protein RHSIM_Rhsim02G0065000 [Rhododendron simsii]